MNLPPDERALLRVLPRQLASTLGSLDVSADTPPEHLRRLFPVANPQDPVAEEAFVRRQRSGLTAQRLEALDVLSRTADAERVDEDEMAAWLGALNDLRLALGGALGVTEEPTTPDPDAPDYADWVCYHYLSFLQSEVIDALEATLPPPVPGAGDDLPDDPWGEPLGGLRWDGTPLPDQ